MTAFLCGRVARAPGLEELQQLLARFFLVPMAIAAQDLNKLCHGAGAVAPRVQGKSKIEAGLMIVRVRLKSALQVVWIAEMAGLFGKIEGCQHPGHEKWPATLVIGTFFLSLGE